MGELDNWHPLQPLTFMTTFGLCILCIHWQQPWDSAETDLAPCSPHSRYWTSNQLTSAVLLGKYSLKCGDNKELDKLLMISMAELQNFNAMLSICLLGYFCEPTGSNTTLPVFSTTCSFLFAVFFHLEENPHIIKVHDCCSPLENL